MSAYYARHPDSVRIRLLYAQLENAEVQLSECGKVEAQIGEKTILSEKIKKAYEIKGEYARCQDALRNMQTCESALKEQQERAPLLKEQSQSVIQTAKAVKETAEKELKAYTTIYERVNKEVKLLKQIKEAEKSVKTSLLIQKNSPHRLIFLALCVISDSILLVCLSCFLRQFFLCFYTFKKIFRFLYFNAKYFQFLIFPFPDSNFPRKAVKNFTNT